jgi:DNA-binding transcriptional LysR family regulator
MPDVHVNIRIGSNTVLHELLQRREIEFYIGGVPLDSDNFAAAHNMSVQPVAASSGLRLMVREGHPLLGIGSIRERMPEYPVVAGTLVRDTISKTDVLALGIQRPTIEIDDYSLLTNLVRNSDAILVTSSIFNHERTVEGLVALSEGVTMSRPVTYALMSSGHQKLSTAGQRVATFLADSIERSIEAGHARSNEGEQR